ncbi:MAG: hypothetical protein KJ970_03385 [Candidatus Eisenbacteria bacterium]|uniref:Uncharacterized protein n=1 Tax=Eiseniibacteriota bacterium TaxID=2212470 RepID=A0A948RXB1_UNCEI|nr:hypothetical protein [Candidatus Eisenbacteria bacterium]MBU1949505.1 hypothetical protein [Candidatus Eisenbacteria bacterium]MBU2689944.1 hypothetical protein [Candidatus Eisenbacteria bacterium]
MKLVYSVVILLVVTMTGCGNSAATEPDEIIMGPIFAYGHEVPLDRNAIENDAEWESLWTIDENGLSLEGYRYAPPPANTEEQGTVKPDYQVIQQADAAASLAGSVEEAAELWAAVILEHPEYFRNVEVCGNAVTMILKSRGGMFFERIFSTENRTPDDPDENPFAEIKAELRAHLIGGGWICFGNDYHLFVSGNHICTLTGVITQLRQGIAPESIDIDGVYPLQNSYFWEDLQRSGGR